MVSFAIDDSLLWPVCINATNAAQRSERPYFRARLVVQTPPFESPVGKIVEFSLSPDLGGETLSKTAVLRRQCSVGIPDRRLPVASAEARVCGAEYSSTHRTGRCPLLAVSLIPLMQRLDRMHTGTARRPF